MKHYFTRNGSHVVPVSGFEFDDGATRGFVARMDLDEFACRLLAVEEAGFSCAILREDGYVYECSRLSAQRQSATHLEVRGAVTHMHMALCPEKTLAAIQCAAAGHG